MSCKLLKRKNEKGRKIMKRLVYFMIISMSLSLAFSGGKPCCNKQASKNTVSCKFNHVAKGKNKDAPVFTCIGSDKLNYLDAWGNEQI